MDGMTQVRLISSLAASEIYNEALEKLRVCVPIFSVQVESLTALGHRQVRRPPEWAPSSRHLWHGGGS